MIDIHTPLMTEDEESDENFKMVPRDDDVAR